MSGRARSPIPPPREPRGGVRPVGRDDRGRVRPRSPSPDRYRRSPPRFPKRYRRDDEYQHGNDRYGRGDGPYRRGPVHGYGYDNRHDDRSYDRAGPAGYDRSGPGRPRADKGKNTGMLSFKEFMLSIPDDLGPAEAQAKYSEYQARYYGDKTVADFEANKNNPEFKAKYDPLTIEEALIRRNKDSVSAFKTFKDDFAAGKYDPTKPGFNQGAFELGAPKTAPEAEMTEADAEAQAEAEAAGAVAASKGPQAAEPHTAPPLTWKPQRVAADLRLAKLLILKLDDEKGLTGNPLTEEGDVTMADADGGAADGAAPAAAAAPSLEKKMATVRAENITVTDANLAAQLGVLDVRLAYLWHVHGVDYYGGHECSEAEYRMHEENCRTLRCPKPEDGEEGSEQQEIKQKELLARTVHIPWRNRVESGDPMVNMCKRSQIEQELDKWIESQIIKKEENKWANKLSSKMFVEKKFVVKHIRTKHDTAVQKAKEEIAQRIFYEQFKEARQAEQAAAQAEEARLAAEADAAAAADTDAHDDTGYEGVPFGGRGMRGGMRGAMRGMRGGMRGGRGGRMPHMMMDPGMMMMGMGPAGGHMGPVLVPAPGAGPFGPFVVQEPAPMAPPMYPMDPMMMMGGGMGGRGMRMPMRGGRGGFGGHMAMMMGGPGAKLDPRGIKEYFDLDAPQNNRAVLDYGDL